MDSFLRFLLGLIGKYVSSHFPYFKEDALQVALKYNLIYAQSRYVYTIIPNLTRPGAANAMGESHAIDGIIGSISHPPHPPYLQPHMSYGQPQGGTSSTYTYPPLAPSHGNPYQCPSTSYPYPHPHQSMPGLAITSPSYPNVSTNYLYPYAPPTTPATPTSMPQPLIPPPLLPQQNPPPQGQVYV